MEIFSLGPDEDRRTSLSCHSNKNSPVNEKNIRKHMEKQDEKSTFTQYPYVLAFGLRLHASMLI